MCKSIRSHNSLVLGKLSGKHAFVQKLESLGFGDVEENRVEKLFEQFKNLADKKKYVLDEDIIALVAGDAAKFKGRIELKHFEISRREGNKPKAIVTIILDDEEYEKEALGDGPVDAAYNAINIALNDRIVLDEYKLEAITGDTDAQAQVVVIIENKGNRFIGRAQSTDVVEASIEAYINAINRLYKEKD